MPIDTFGDETYWTDTLRMHEVIAANVSPAAALDVGLKVDIRSSRSGSPARSATRRWTTPSRRESPAGRTQMEARARFLGHAIHQQLIPMALGPLVVAVVFDVIRLVTGNGYWSEIAYWMIAAGIIAALVAAPFGILDWTKIPAGTRAKRVGLLHGGGNVVAVVLFAASWLLRRDDPRAPEMLALVLSFAGAGLSGIAGWLGGELVGRLGVAVDDGAHVDAPSSLSGRPAGRGATVTGHT